MPPAHKSIRILPSNRAPTHPLNQVVSNDEAQMVMGIRLNGWPLDLFVAIGWLLLVASVGVLFSPDDATLAHAGYGKIAMMCVVISGVCWLSARQSQSMKTTQSDAGITAGRPPSRGRLSNPNLPNKNFAATHCARYRLAFRGLAGGGMRYRRAQSPAVAYQSR